MSHHSLTSKQILSQLYRPLELGEHAQLKVISGGVLNTNYQLHDQGRKFLVKRLVNSKFLGINRRERYQVQSALAGKGLAPKPLFLSACQSIYVETWLDDVEAFSSISYPLKQTQIAALADAMVRIHRVAISDIPSDVKISELWRLYAKGANSPLLIKEAKAMQIEYDGLECSPKLCHNDLSIAHLSLNSKLLIDWEYACLGDPYFDLMSCVSINQFNQAQTRFFLNGYAQKRGLCEQTLRQHCVLRMKFVDFTYRSWTAMVRQQSLHKEA